MKWSKQFVIFSHLNNCIIDFAIYMKHEILKFSIHHAPDTG